MYRSNTETDESRITTDREKIRGWVGEHDSIPVRYSGVEGESNELRIVPAADESHEERTWDEFFEIAEWDDQVVVYHGEDAAEPFEVTSRDQAVGRSTVADEEVEAALVDGETVTVVGRRRSYRSRLEPPPDESLRVDVGRPAGLARVLALLVL